MWSVVKTALRIFARRELKDSATVYQIIDVLCEDFTIAPVLENALFSPSFFDFFDLAVHYSS
ncbi:hypothetical protein AGMMS49546_07510 [Spirochaetia bacterium]|nr:hypothetical protein AGMMS49546_07510 [Spirochaetia bacterium]